MGTVTRVMMITGTMTITATAMRAMKIITKNLHTPKKNTTKNKYRTWSPPPLGAVKRRGLTLNYYLH